MWKLVCLTHNGGFSLKNLHARGGGGGLKRNVDYFNPLL